jgi:hypothetical protein
MAMTWYNVKSKIADRSLNHILCYQPASGLRERRGSTRREAWVEDAHGKILDEITFKPK